MIIDAHQHFWNLAEVDYPWLVPEYGPIYRTFEPDELEPQLRAAGVDRTVLVQAADSLEDTEAMLARADRYPWIAGVVGWIPLKDPVAAVKALGRLTEHPKFVGIRHLIHEEADPDWILDPSAQDGLALLAERNLTFDVVSVLDRHLENVTTLAKNHPDLTLIIDHLAKPPIKDKGWQPWADLFAAAARFPNVHAKISGLNTAADWESWKADDIRPYIDHAVDHFGPERLMFGSDWPVAILAGDYQKVKDATDEATRHLSEQARASIWWRTAEATYRLPRAGSQATGGEAM